MPALFRPAVGPTQPASNTPIKDGLSLLALCPTNIVPQTAASPSIVCASIVEASAVASGNKPTDVQPSIVRVDSSIAWRARSRNPISCRTFSIVTDSAGRLAASDMPAPFRRNSAMRSGETPASFSLPCERRSDHPASKNISKICPYSRQFPLALFPHAAFPDHEENRQN